MDLQQALSILGRVGAGETLSLSELTQARDVIARQLHSLRGSATPDLDALTQLGVGIDDGRRVDARLGARRGPHGGLAHFKAPGCKNGSNDQMENVSDRRSAP